MSTPVASPTAEHRAETPSPGALAGRFIRHRGPVTCVAGIPGKNAAVSAAYDSAVAYVDLERRTLELMGYHEHLVNAVSVNPAGTKVASSSSDYTICIWDLATRRPERVLRGHGDDVNAFAWIGERRGASVSHDQRVYLWDLDTGAVLRILEGHEKYAMSVDYADGRIYSAGDDMTMRQWDAESGDLLRTWGPFEVETDTCAIDPLHGRVVLGADDGCIRVFDIREGALIREVAAHGSGIKKVAVSPITGDILSAAYDQRLLVWDARTFELGSELAADRATWERSINWTPDGARILAGTFDGTVLVWDAKTGERLAEIGRTEGSIAGEAPGNLCFNDVDASPRGETALVSDDGHVRLARLNSGEAQVIAEVAPASGRVLMNGVILDGDRVIAGAHDQKVHFFHRRGEELGDEIEVPLGEGPINCIRVSHHPGYEGDAFVGCYSGAVVRLGRDGEVKGTLRFNEGAVKALA
ncbi:MAG: PQQ-binding-like beta-propeller repeat protein, partial [Holophagales bacterium]|nr:PQQ-binding-like beta-propeller repeat protein [Holophagales bacterium]